MGLSVIIPIHGFLREEIFHSLLSSLANQEGLKEGDIEIIVVEQRDGDKVHEAPGIHTDFISSVKHIALPDQAAGFNKSWCINCAARQAQYDILVVVDVDMSFEPDYLSLILDYWNKYKPKFLICWESIRAESGRDYPDGKTFSSLKLQTAGGVWACSRDFFWCVGGMNETYFGYGGEDGDMWARVNACLGPAYSFNTPVLNYALVHKYHDHLPPSPVAGRLVNLTRHAQKLIQYRLRAENLGDPGGPRPINMNEDHGPLLAHWCFGDNFGDALTPYLIKKLTGIEPIYIDPAEKSDHPVYMLSGSMLDSTAVTHSIVWGCGIAWANERIPPAPDVRAVRGPLSQNAMLRSKQRCPDVHGDPGLLLPRIYQPGPHDQRFLLGIIPHEEDYELVMERHQKEEGIRVIDITSPVEAVIDVVTSCDAIGSSSLHGLITAQAYGIPNAWVEFSDKVVGDGTKFHDFLMSIGAKPYLPVDMRSELDLRRIWDGLRTVATNLDLDALAKSCPFPFPDMEPV